MYVSPKLALISCLAALLTTGCINNVQRESTTGNVTVINQVETTDKKTGSVTIETKTADESAERSVTDKGAQSLLKPQKIFTPGSFFDSYYLDKSSTIVASVFNKDGTASDLWSLSKGKVRLTNTEYYNNYPSYSQNGNFIYFTSDRGKKVTSIYDQNSYIWRMNSNGAGGITRIGSPSYNIQDPIESPNGEKIIYSTREYYGNDYYTWYMDKNGSLPTQLINGHGARWITDDKIMFVSRDENTEHLTIWTMMLDGSEMTQLIVDKELDCFNPSIDPTGQYIAYVKQNSEDVTTRDLYVYDLKTGLSQQLTTNKSRDDLPEWSNDGQHLYFRSSRGLQWNVWRVSANAIIQPSADDAGKI